MFEKVFMAWAENHPEEMKDFLIRVYKNLPLLAKQELVKEFLGGELYESLKWCAECHKNNLDFAKFA